MMRLTREMRAAIRGGTFPDFVRRFVRRLYPGGKRGEVPVWVWEALQHAGISMDE